MTRRISPWLLVTLILTSSPTAESADSNAIDLVAYYPGVQAHTHALVAADGAKTVFHFPSSWDPVRGGVFRRETDGCLDWHVWYPDSLQYLGVDCPARRLNVMILPITLRALPRRATLPWKQEVRAWELSISSGTAALGPPDTMRVSLERGALDEEAAIVLHFTRRDGSGETWWLVDRLPIVPQGGCAPGMRRLAAFNGTGFCPMVGFGFFI